VAFDQRSRGPGATALERERKSSVTRADIYRSRVTFYRRYREELTANGEDAGHAERLLLDVTASAEEEERRIEEIDEAIRNWTPPPPPPPLPRRLRRRRERRASRRVARRRRIHNRTQDPMDRLNLGYAISDLERAGTAPPRPQEVKARTRVPHRRPGRARGAGRPRARRTARSSRAGPDDAGGDPPPGEPDSPAAWAHRGQGAAR